MTSAGRGRHMETSQMSNSDSDGRLAYKPRCRSSVMRWSEDLQVGVLCDEMKLQWETVSRACR